MSYWSDKEEEIFLSMFEKGCTINEVCEVLKSRTRTAVRRHGESIGFIISDRKKVGGKIDMEAYKKLMK